MIEIAFSGNYWGYDAENPPKTLAEAEAAFPAYSVMAGCYGVLSATIPWRELAPYRR